MSAVDVVLVVTMAGYMVSTLWGLVTLFLRGQRLAGEVDALRRDLDAARSTQRTVAEYVVLRFPNGSYLRRPDLRSPDSPGDHRFAGPLHEAWVLPRPEAEQRRVGLFAKCEVVQVGDAMATLRA